MAEQEKVKEEEPKKEPGKHEAHVAQYKKDVVDRIGKLIKEYPIVGVVNMENLPAPQLQGMRSKLRESAVLLMTKRRLIRIALENSKQEKKDIEKLEPHLLGMPALLFTKDNPFKLSNILQKNKSPAPAKAGQTAPNDIVVNAGPTPFAPGPIIGELATIGIKSGVEGGKVAIKEDSVVAKRGEKIKGEVAGILARLGVMPMEVGLDLVAAYEDGTIYDKDILSIDGKEYADRVDNAARWAINLAFNSGYPTKETVTLLIGKAFRETKAVGLEGNLFEKGIIGDILSKAEREMLSLKDTAKVPEAEEKKPEEKEEKKEEAPVEKPTEKKPEEEKKEETQAEKEKPAEEPKKEEKKEIPAPPKEVEEKKPEEPKEEIQKEPVNEEPKVEEPKKEEPVKAPEVPQQEKAEPGASSQQFKPSEDAIKLKEGVSLEEKKKEDLIKKPEIKVPTREELEENIKKREKEKELEEVEEIAKDIARKHALGKK